MRLMTIEVSREKFGIEDSPYVYLHQRPLTGISALVVVSFLITFTGIILYKVFVIKFFGTSFAISTNYFVILTYTVISSLVVLMRFPIALKYDPTKFLRNEYVPTVTVIIPAYNEEAIIEETIRDTLKTRYPQDKLEILVVDDGSKDKTGEIIKRLAEEEPRVTSVMFAKNAGKREALCYGFAHAKGEIVVTIDSDTSVHPECIREVVKPFMDKEVGGVCGHTDVKNQDNFYGRIQQSNYFIGFHLYKKAESLYGSIFCLSGCISAYRKSLVMTFLEEWKNQYFLGQRCTFGEDRGLTTLKLKTKAKVIYTTAAISRTFAPNTFKKLWKQRLRWRRSFFREPYWQAKFMFRRSIASAALIYTNSIITFETQFL